MTRQIGRVVVIAACLTTLPADFHPATSFGAVGIGLADAIAQSRAGDGNRGNGSAGERSARPDRDIDRDRGSGRNERERSAPDRGGTVVNRSLTPSASHPGPAAAIGRALVDRADEPGIAPTEADTARSRAMVEIAKELGAAAPDLSDGVLITGPVTQEMLEFAESAYVAAVQGAWEAHGFPWSDSDVLRTLGELEALVSTLEGIMQNSVSHLDGGALARVEPDINDDGFVDINDLWDAHLR